MTDDYIATDPELDPDVRNTPVPTDDPADADVSDEPEENDNG